MTIKLINLSKMIYNKLKVKINPFKTVLEIKKAIVVIHQI